MSQVFHSTVPLTMAVLVLLGACQQEARRPGDPPAAVMRKERAECEARGGEYAPAGLFGHACYLPMPDAGKACATAGDCAGVCLADTRQCSATAPLFGCYAFLDEAGQAVEICVD